MPKQDSLIPPSPGLLLCNTRLEKQISIDEVCRNLKLRGEIVLAMEDDCFDHSASVYSKGFARQYAQFLQIPESIFEQALAEAETYEPPVKSVFSKNTATASKSDRNFRVLSYLVASIFIVLPLVLAYTHFAVRWSQNEPLLKHPISKPGNDTQSLTAATQPGTKSLTGHLQANMLPTMLADNTLARTARLLEIELSADSWLSIIDATGSTLEARLLEGGQSYQYSGSPPYKVQLGRATAARVKFGGELVDLGTISGNEVIDIEIGKPIISQQPN